jgi:peptidoglycan/LPS O-acetylase OafA/YrhL
MSRILRGLPPRASGGNGGLLPRQAEAFRLGHRPALDGLRGVAILMVLAVHTAWALLPGGFIGVDLFFVLSGFLITGLLLQERQDTGRIHLGRFYLRRVLRLLPALLAVVLSCCLYTLATESPVKVAATLDDALGVIGYYANWHFYFSRADHNDMLRHAWSLSVEEQFYTLWPALLTLLLALRVRRRWLVVGVLAGIVVPAALRIVLWQGRGSIRLYIRTDTRADALFCGALVALAVYGGLLARTRRSRRLLRLGALLAVAVLAWHVPRARLLNHGYMFRAGFTLMALASGVLIAAAVCCPPRPLRWVLEFGPLRWLGRISYGLYLWHWPIFCYIGLEVKAALWLLVLLQLAAALAAATASYYWLERPFLRLKDRLGRPRTCTAAPATRPFPDAVAVSVGAA